MSKKTIPLEWKLIKYKLGDLHEWEKNPVQINEREAKELAKSLKKFNQDLPYVAAAPPNGKAGLPLLDGHQRKMVEVQLNGKPLNSLVPVLVPNRALTEKEKQEWVIRHRKNTGEFDFDKLANYFDVPDLLEWGFSEKELQIGGFEFEDTTQDAEPQIDRAAELLKVWGVKTGDLWQIGEHRLICGDCTDKAVVDRVMGENKIDLLFTSPPYNQGGESRNGDLATNGNGKVALYDEYKDDLPDEDYKELLFRFIEVAAPFVSDVHSVVVNISYNSNARDLYGKVLFSDRNPFTVRETIVWDKKSALNFPNSGIYSRRCEFIFVMSKSSKYLFSDWSGTRWNYYEVSKENQMKEHRAAFPLPLVERGLSEFSNPNSSVYEPFAGTGTTLVACQNLGRRGRAVEISPAYVAVTLQRMSDAFPGIKIKRVKK